MSDDRNHNTPQAEPATDGATPPARGLLRRGLGVVGLIVARGFFVLIFLWCLLAMWYSEIGPGGVRGMVVAAVALGFPLAWFRYCQCRRTIWVAFGLFAVSVIVAWQFKQPSHDRNWTADMATLPEIVFDADLVHIRDVRNCRYRSVEDFDLDYYDATYDLTKLRTVHFMVEQFNTVPGPAHTLMAFGFEDGKHVAISIELRREVGEAFHPLPGIFKQFELMYVVGDERDLIQLRTNHRKHEVYLYPIKASRKDKRNLFVDMLRRANQLRDEPAFYNTLTSSCTTNIVTHVDRIAKEPLPFSYKVLLPAFSDEMAYDLDLIETNLSFEDARKAFRIDEIARDEKDARPFSVRIRER